MISDETRVILEHELTTSLEWNQFFIAMTEASEQGLDEESAALLALQQVKPSVLQ